MKKYDGEFPERFSKEIFDYLSINEDEFPDIYNKFEHPEMNYDYFMKIADSFRSPHIWKYTNNKWVLRRKVWE